MGRRCLPGTRIIKFGRGGLWRGSEGWREVDLGNRLVECLAHISGRIWG